MKNKVLLFAAIGLCFIRVDLLWGQGAGPVRLVFDQAHGELPPPRQLDALAKKLGLETQASAGTITAGALEGARTLYLRAPSKHFTATEAEAIVAFAKGGQLAFAPSVSTQPTIRFTPAEGLMTDVVTIRISGLRPDAQVVVSATMQLAGSWRSHATFIADRRGEVRLDRHRPIEGTYTGIDPMGLWWAMEPEPPAPGAAPPGPPDIREPVVTTFRVELDGTTIATGTYRRWLAKPNVRITDVRDGGLVGQLFEPAGRGPYPAVLVLGGSEGGMDQYAAAGFASRGYVALALAYFRAESLSKELVNIPLEYFLNATDWLQRQRSVDPQRLAIFGKSRGSEAALLLASIATHYRVVIANAPSSVSGAGVGKHNADKPAWTYRGEPIPFAPNDTTVAALRAGIDTAHGSIPIERSHAAVFLVSGGEDRVSRPGASTLMGDLLIDRLKQSKHPYPYEHLSYANAGHSFGMFFLPGPIVAGGGGSPEGNARAGADSTPKLFSFLRQNLDKGGRRQP